MDTSSTIKLAARNLFILKILGFCSITIVNGKSVTKLTDVLYLVVSVSFGIFIIFLSITKKENLASTKSPIADLGNFISYIAAIIVSIISMLAVFCVRHRIWKMVLKLESIEQKFEKVDLIVNYSKVIQINFLFGVVVTAISLPLSLFFYMLEGSILKVLLYTYASVYFAFNVGSSTAYILGAAIRLSSIEDFLIQMLNTNAKQITFVKNVNYERINIFENLADAYNDIMDLCDEINICYGFQLMMSFGLIFFYTLFTLFSTYMDFINEEHLSSVVITSFMFCIYYNFILSAVIISCSLIEKHVSSFCKEFYFNTLSSFLIGRWYSESFKFFHWKSRK